MFCLVLGCFCSSSNDEEEQAFLGGWVFGWFFDGFCCGFCGVLVMFWFLVSWLLEKSCDAPGMRSCFRFLNPG